MGTNTLIIFDDCTAFRDAQKRTSELLNLAFSARQGNQHLGSNTAGDEHC